MVIRRWPASGGPFICPGVDLAPICRIAYILVLAAGVLESSVSEPVAAATRMAYCFEDPGCGAVNEAADRATLAAPSAQQDLRWSARHLRRSMNRGYPGPSPRWRPAPAMP
jgi:hypothetical protein